MTIVVRPDNMGLIDWAAQLLIDFPTTNLPILYNEDAWKEWGNLVISTQSFANKAAPRTDGYSDWRDWAERIAGLF